MKTSTQSPIERPALTPGQIADRTPPSLCAYVGRDYAIEMLAALRGARDAMRAALPFCPPDDVAHYVGEWLGEIESLITKAQGGAK